MHQETKISIIYNSFCPQNLDVISSVKYGETKFVFRPFWQGICIDTEALKSCLAEALSKNGLYISLETELFENKGLLEKACLITGNAKELFRLVKESSLCASKLPIRGRHLNRTLFNWRLICERSIQEYQWNTLAKICLLYTSDAADD